jgi:hypothetical protein
MKGGGTLDWCALVSLIAHPSKVLIIEALAWIDRPLSASELSKSCDGKPTKGALSYHFNALAEAGVLTHVGSEQVRGAWRQLYVFSPLVKA